MAPIGEARRPSTVGVIQLGEMLEAGVKVSLSTDHTTNYNCDPFVAMRVLFALHQHRIGDKIPLTVKRLVQLATLDGAVDLGIADKTRLAHARQARRHHPGAHHRHQHDCRSATPTRRWSRSAQPTNVDTVIVDGRVLRQAGKFTALDHARSCATPRRRPPTCAPRPGGRRERPSEQASMKAVHRLATLGDVDRLFELQTAIHHGTRAQRDVGRGR